jgi:hypothetical protein
LLKNIFYKNLINILDDFLFNDVKRYTNRFTLNNSEGDLTLSEDLTFYIFELPKFDLSVDTLTRPVDEWIYLIKHAHEMDLSKSYNFKYIPINRIMEVIGLMKKT